MSRDYVTDFLSHLRGVEPHEGKTDRWRALCPCHDDHNPQGFDVSLNRDGAIIAHCLVCHANGERVCQALGLPTSALYPPRPQKPAIKPASGLTVAELAAAKGFSELELFGWGCDDVRHNGRPAVAMTFYDEQGKPYPRRHLRVSLDVEPRFVWESGRSEKPIPYGLSALPEARQRGKLVLAEGQTDVWALRKHTIPALGFPGSSTTGALEDRHLRGIRSLYAIREPGEGGDRFLAGVSKRLSELRWLGDARAVSLAAKDPHALWRQDPEGFHLAFARACARSPTLSSALGEPERTSLDVERLVDLLDEELPEMDAIVPGLLFEGVTLLVGRPKLGKSFLALLLALSIAAGSSRVLGRLPCVGGDVLYLCLEDGKRRLRRRVLDLLCGEPPPASFDYKNVWPALADGGLEKIRAWLEARRQARLVVIDTMKKVKSMEKRTMGTIYDFEYEIVNPLQELGKQWPGVSFLVVSHANRSGSEDPMELVTGGYGSVAAADGAIAMIPGPDPRTALLNVVHRDADGERFFIHQGPNGAWQIKDR